MKATGIVRRIDDLGRVVIPKEIRRTLKIREGDPLEIYTNSSGEVIFKKYSPIGELGDFAAGYAETLSKTAGRPVCITDRINFIYQPGDGTRPEIADGIEKYRAGVIMPIISEGDSIGSVVLLSDSETPLGEVDEKLAGAAAGFLARQMEL